jgi:CBS domain containing-hemolysin-like protein
MVSLSVLLLIILLVIFNGFFVSAEFAFLRLTKTRLQVIQEKKSWGAEKLQLIMKNVNHYITSLQIGITVTTLGLGAIGASFFADLVETGLDGFDLSEQTQNGISFLIGFLIVISILIIFGELAPKMITSRRIEKTALLTAIPTYWYARLLNPVTRFYSNSAIVFLKLFQVQQVQKVYKAVYSEDELKRIIKESKEEGEIDETEQMLINRIFDFTDTTVKEIITPRFEIVAFPVETDIEKIMTKAKETGYSRFPIYEDKLDSIIGFVHIKDVILEYRDPGFTLRNILREAIIIHEGMRLDTLLRKMQIKRSQVAIVIDEYGSVEGLVTIEDLLEEIVGEIDDEFDVEPSELISRGGDKSHLIDAKVSIDYFNETLDASIKSSDSVTLAGFILEQLENLPEEGSSFELENWKFVVEKMDGNRIEQVRVKRV